MAQGEIFYFSGTGNSFAVARDLAERLHANLRSVASVMNQECIVTEAEMIGFVFPIYDFKPPRLMESVIRKFEDLDAKYLFAVCTYGIAPAQSLRHFHKLIASSGGRLAAGFAVGMPHNAVGSGAVTTLQHARMFERWKRKREEICDYLRARKAGTIESSHLILGFLQPTVIRMMPSALKLLMRMLLRGVQSLAFTADHKCNGCGMCARICPVNNIAIVNSHPVWSDHCVSCFACLQWCPKEAMSLGGVNLNIKAYHHPEVKIADMMRHV